VLDLYAGVHLDKVEVVALHQKLHGPGVCVPRLPGQPDSRRGHLLPNFGAYSRRRSLLQHLLPPALHGALPLVEMDDVAVVVAHNLDLHVARPDEQLLQVERPVTEGGLGLSLRDLHGLAELLLVSGHPDAPAAASSRCLDHDGVADPSGCLDSIVGRGGLFRAGYNRHVGPLRQPAGRGLVAHLLDGLRRRPDEGEPGVPASCGERGILGQETVARMNPFGPGLLGGH
jgi:hypothetical protein